jgi:hypothetical protein
MNQLTIRTAREALKVADMLTKKGSIIHKDAARFVKKNWRMIAHRPAMEARFVALATGPWWGTRPTYHHVAPAKRNNAPSMEQLNSLAAHFSR